MTYKLCARKKPLDKTIILYDGDSMDDVKNMLVDLDVEIYSSLSAKNSQYEEIWIIEYEKNKPFGGSAGFVAINKFL